MAIGLQGRGRDTFNEGGAVVGKAKLRNPVEPIPQGGDQGPGNVNTDLGSPDMDTHYGDKQTPRERMPGMPSPEGLAGGQLTPPRQGPAPAPAAMAPPQPNMLPNPSPKALTSNMFGRAGGLLGGGLGVPGQSEQGSPDPTDLLALIASLLGRS